jgi:hypothetical protein
MFAVTQTCSERYGKGFNLHFHQSSTVPALSAGDDGKMDHRVQWNVGGAFLGSCLPGPFLPKYLVLA